MRRRPRRQMIVDGDLHRTPSISETVTARPSRRQRASAVLRRPPGGGHRGAARLGRGGHRRCSFFRTAAAPCGARRPPACTSGTRVVAQGVPERRGARCRPRAPGPRAPAEPAEHQLTPRSRPCPAPRTSSTSCRILIAHDGKPATCPATFPLRRRAAADIMTMWCSVILGSDQGVVHRCLRRSHGRAGRGLGRDRGRRARAGRRADRVRQDAGRLPLGARPAARPAPADDPRERCRVLYVSPLKALAADVERNLRSPLVGITAAAAAARAATPPSPGRHPHRRHAAERAPALRDHRRTC